VFLVGLMIGDQTGGTRSLKPSSRLASRLERRPRRPSHFCSGTRILSETQGNVKSVQGIVKAISALRDRKLRNDRKQKENKYAIWCSNCGSITAPSLQSQVTAWTELKTFFKGHRPLEILKTWLFRFAGPEKKFRAPS